MTIEIPQNEGEIQVTPENIEGWRTAIATLREKKGVEEQALQLIRAVRLQTIWLDLSEHVANLFWEESLVGQHMVMGERDKPEDEKDEIFASRGLAIMSDAALQAHMYVQSHELTHLLGASYRFLGRVATYKGDHNTAKGHYERSLALYKEEQDPIIRSRKIELQAFLSHALMMTGDIKGGMALAQQTFEEANQSEVGVALRDHDYYTWAVWTSGIPIHLCHALATKNVRMSKAQKIDLDEMLIKAEEILHVPAGVATWGDERFQFRRDEIAKIRKGKS
jgi:hypothetical protein